MSWRYDVVFQSEIKEKNFWIEYFSTECRKTKTTVNTTANLKKKENNFKSPREFIVKATTLSKARENAGDLVMIGFVLADSFEKKARIFWNLSRSNIFPHYCRHSVENCYSWVGESFLDQLENAAQ